MVYSSGFMPQFQPYDINEMVAQLSYEEGAQVDFEDAGQMLDGLEPSEMTEWPGNLSDAGPGYYDPESSVDIPSVWAAVVSSGQYPQTSSSDAVTLYFDATALGPSMEQSMSSGDWVLATPTFRYPTPLPYDDPWPSHVLNVTVDPAAISPGAIGASRQTSSIADDTIDQSPATPDSATYPSHSSTATSSVDSAPLPITPEQQQLNGHSIQPCPAVCSSYSALPHLKVESPSPQRLVHPRSPFPPARKVGGRRIKSPSAGPATAPRGKSHARKRPADHVPRPKNAFIFFRSDFARGLPREVERDHRNISRIAGAVWGRLGEEGRKKYNEMAEMEKVEHAKKYPKYKYTPDNPRKEPSPDKVSKKKVSTRDVEERERCNKIADLYMRGLTADELKQACKKQESTDQVLPVAETPSLGNDA